MKPALVLAGFLSLAAGGAGAQEFYNSVPDVLATSAALEQYKEEVEGESSGNEKAAIRDEHADCLERAQGEQHGEAVRQTCTRKDRTRNGWPSAAANGRSGPSSAHCSNAEHRWATISAVRAGTLMAYHPVSFAAIAWRAAGRRTRTPPPRSLRKSRRRRRNSGVRIHP